MKKTGLLHLLEQLKLRENEERTPELEHLTAVQVIDVLLDYLNDPQLREAIEELPI